MLVVVLPDPEGEYRHRHDVLPAVIVGDGRPAHPRRRLGTRASRSSDRRSPPTDRSRSRGGRSTTKLRSGGGPPVAGFDPRGPRRRARADEPGAGHRRPGVLARRADLDGSSLADAHGIARRVRRLDPGAHPPWRRQVAAHRRPLRRRVRAGSGRPADCAVVQHVARCAERADRRRVGDAAGGSRTARHPPVHEWFDERAEGRDDPRSRPVGEHRRDRRGGRDSARR